MKYKVDLYCVCWNEITVLPFVLQYWKRFVRHAYVYDNGSDDGTLEYLSKFDWITVKNFKTDGFNDDVNMNIKNNCWIGSDADYVVVCDLDECLYATDMERFFSWMDNSNIAVYSPQWVECYSYDFPTYNEEKLCHELIGGGVSRNESYLHKSIVFNPRIVSKMNYSVGCHHCRPVGNGGEIKKCGGTEAYLVHLKHIGFEYVCNRFEALKNRLSDYNKKNGYGSHYITCNRDNMKLEYEKNIPLVKMIG